MREQIAGKSRASRGQAAGKSAKDRNRKSKEPRGREANLLKQCLACGGGPLERAAKKATFEYKGQVFTYSQPGVWCKECGEGFLEKSDKEATDPLLVDFQARVDNRLTSGDIRRIRRKLGLTQKQAGEIIGGGPNAFSRYETGKAYPIKGTENFLRLLDRHPELLEELPKEAAA